MKKFKLFALTAFAMLSINAFADVDDYKAKSNLLYKVTAESTTAKEVSFAGILDTDVTDPEIPATITVTDAKGNDIVYNVTAIADEWTTPGAVGTTGFTRVAVTTVKSITIKAPMATIPVLATGGDKFTKLVVNFDYSAKGDVTIGDGTQSFDAHITEVDLSNLKAKTKVTIAEQAFYNNAVLAKVTLPAGAVEVGNKAFGGDEKLETIDTKGITAFGNGSFSKCSKLATIDLSAAKTIGSYAFYKTAAKTLTIPANVESIGSYSFGSMAALEEVTINGTKDLGLTTIPSKCFDGCVKLVKVTINAPKVATIAAADAFPANAYTNIDLENSGLDALTNLDLSNAKESLTEFKLPANDVFTAIADNQFQDFTVLKAITIPEKVTTIGKYAFDGAKALEEVTIAGAAEIKGFAFGDCEKLATVTITGAVTNIGGCAFIRCKALESIDLSKTAIPALPIKTFFNCEKLATITLPETVKLIGEQSLEGTILTELVAPGVTTIDKTALGVADGSRKENTNLTKVVLGAATIGKYTFDNCTALASATIGFKDIKDAIEAYAFNRCTSLTSFDWDCSKITDEDNPQINTNAFNKCTAYIVINTSSMYSSKFAAPKFCIYGSSSAKTFKTVKDASGAAAAYGLLYDALNNIAVSASDAKVYTVYVDREANVAYFTAMMPSGGKYKVKAGTHAILKTDAPKENIPVEYVTTGVVGYDDVFTVTAETAYAEFLSEATGKNADNATNADFAANGNYLYRLSNNGSFGFSAYKKTLKPGQYYILLKKQPAAGRLQTVWLDENGNVENDATGINSVVEKSENAGVTYNLAGQKVRSGYKGVVIRNGKKMILK